MSDFEINLTDVEELDPSSIGPMPAGDYEMVAQTWKSCPPTMCTFRDSDN